MANLDAFQLEHPLDELSTKIVETAKSLFDQHGIENVSMHQIAKTTGVGQGTLYRRFPSKNTICQHLMHHKFQQFAQDVTRTLAEMRQETVQSRLSALVTKMIVLMEDDLKWIKALIHAERLEDCQVNMFELPPFVFLRDHFIALLEEAGSRNELVPLDKKFAAIVAASALRPELIFYLQGIGYTPEQIALHYVQSFIAPLFNNRHP